MQARLKIAVAVIAALAMTFALGACTKKNQTAAPAASGSAAGGTVKVAFVPKLQGIPYFEAMNAGGKEAASKLGNVEWLYQGPTSADAAAQADIVNSYIQQKVNTLFIAPNDPDSMAPLIKQGIDAGIKVGTSDTDAPNSDRELMVLMASAEGIGQADTDALMKAMGGKGKFAIVSCGETAAQLNQWIDEIKKYSKQKYPDAQLVNTVYAGEDVAKATQMATDIMNAQPDIKGFLGVCSTAGPGVAQAVQNAGRREGLHRRHGYAERHEEVSAERCGVGRRFVGRQGSGLPDRLGRAAVGAGQAVPSRAAGPRVWARQRHVRQRNQDLADGEATDLHQGERRELQLLGPNRSAQRIE
jgi:rhamnose transport system substrate-binding protein